MKPYKIVIASSALSDIQDIIDWYNKRLPKLGSRFHQAVQHQISMLKNNANSYNIRYTTVRCTIVKKFPYLIHFTIDDQNKTVEIFAVIHTSRNPKLWEERSKPL